MVSRNEIAKSRSWREAQGLTVIELARLTGWTPASIHRFEEGMAWVGGEKKKISERAWTRWKLACAGVEYTVYKKGDFWEHRK